MRQDFLKNDFPTEDLLLQLRPVSDEYALISNEPIYEREQGKILRIFGKADHNCYALKEFKHNYALKNAD